MLLRFTELEVEIPLDDVRGVHSERSHLSTKLSGFRVSQIKVLARSFEAQLIQKRQHPLVAIGGRLPQGRRHSEAKASEDRPASDDGAHVLRLDYFETF